MSLFSLYTASGPVKAIREETAVTLGVFDGVHRGHRALLRQLEGGAPTAVTLASHPSFVLGRRGSEDWLDEEQEHLRLLLAAGVKYVAVMPFTDEVARLTACQLTRLMHNELHMRTLLLGYDGRFGSRQDDDFALLPQLADELGIMLKHGRPYLLDGDPVSSSRIRRALGEGNVEEAATLLGRPYSVGGTVQHGRGVGHTLGFPTANIDLAHSRKTLPTEGVYIVRIGTPGAHLRHIGMANLGTAPTYGIEQRMLEVHLLDYSGDLYDKAVEVEFLHRLRDTRRFDSREALQRQLENDLQQARQWL
ncbi:MAG: riboflavin biosynthesis protein RibF [Bacteroidales bacterium]|nr:riboflavin biosynthesis protein RibF [Bacteroidales bacterium]